MKALSYQGLPFLSIRASDVYHRPGLDETSKSQPAQLLLFFGEGDPSSTALTSYCLLHLSYPLKLLEHGLLLITSVDQMVSMGRLGFRT